MGGRRARPQEGPRAMTTAAGTPRYSRYKASKKLEGDSRRQALAAYVAHYAKIAEAQPELLNQKVPRAAFDSVLHEIGLLMQQRARELATGAGAVRDFLGKNPVPACLGGELTDEVRAFCLLLNALRQWSVGEQLAMDRLLLSGNVRKELKERKEREKALGSVGIEPGSVDIFYRRHYQGVGGGMAGNFAA